MLLNRISTHRGAAKVLFIQNSNVAALGSLYQTRSFMKYFKKNKPEEKLKALEQQQKMSEVAEKFDSLPREQQIKQRTKLFNSIGISRDIYIYPDFKFTDYILHPISVMKAIMYKVMDFGQSTAQVIAFRNAKRDQLQFKFFRQAAGKIFVDVHKYFASNELNKVYPYVNTNVALALKKRREILNKKELQLEWKLVDWKTYPMVSSVTAVPMPALKSYFISVGFRFDTLQQLIVRNKSGEVITTTEKRVVDSFVFLFNPDTGEALLQGKIPPKAIGEKPMSKAQMGSVENPQDLFKKYADIFA